MRAADKFSLLFSPDLGRVVKRQTLHHLRGLPKVAALSAVVVGLAACDEDPFVFRWNATPNTARLYSLARPEPNLASGFTFTPPPTSFVVETPDATGSWDVALDTESGALVLKPPGALGISARGAIATLGSIPFDDVDEAPGDTLLFEVDDPVVVTLGTVYAIRTNRRPGSFGSSCVYYAKMEPLVVDVAGGVLDFRYVASPVCNNRSLVPPD